VKKVHYSVLSLLFILMSCASDSSNKDSLAELKNIKVDLSDSTIDGSLEKALQSYQKFLEQTPDSAMTPEAIRRLADLKIQKEFGTLEGATKTEKKAAQEEAKNIPPPANLEAPKISTIAAQNATTESTVTDKESKADKKKKTKGKVKGKNKETGDEFEKRATKTATVKSKTTEVISAPDGSGADLQVSGAVEAIALYKKLLAKYPNYDRNDQVLYQLSRAYEEIGQVEEAMKVMNKIVKDYAKSRYFDEIQFRRGEFFYTRKKFLDSEDAFKAIVDIGAGSSYYEIALYKLGWSFYKQELYEEALHKFISLLDYKINTGYDFEHPKGTNDEKRIEDTFTVVSLSFSNLGGADAVIGYFQKNGKRAYEVNIYSNLGEYYLEKRRYSDAAVSYKAFVKSNPFHKMSPHFDTRVIEIYKKGQFPKLVIDANKEYVINYGLKSEYWKYFDIKTFPEVVGYVKTSLKELANHYHSLYQEKKLEKSKPENFLEATRWYREFLKTFPKEFESPEINIQLADLLLENKSFREAAVEYEHSAYDYPHHAKSPAAGYSAVYAHRENLGLASKDESDRVKREVIRSSLKFAEIFPSHEKAALVMEAAIDDIYSMKDYEFAVKAGRKFINNFPAADEKLRRSTWLIVAHSSFELANFKEAEEAYFNVLILTAENDKTRVDIVENLAASIYKQGEQASKLSDFKTAAEHFLRVGISAPTAKIRPAADYDGATALIQLKDWERAADVLKSFRNNYAGHQLQPEVTKKIAYVYKQAGKLALAAAEYERIETESQDVAVRREALQLAADLYVDVKDTEKAMQVYRRYVGYFPKPLEPALETRNKIANVLKARNETAAYFEELKQIVVADAKAGADRTDRTRYLGATSSLILTEPLFTQFVDIKLVKPFDKNLARKKMALKAAKDGFEKLISYEVGDTTSAATFYIAELYFNFNRSLVESERPADLNALEMEQYELAIEEQAFPFEEKTIQIHEKNLELLTLGIFSTWIENSFEKLAKLSPARYAKYEQSSGFVNTINQLNYAELTDPLPVIVSVVPPPASAPVVPVAEPEPVPVAPVAVAPEPQNVKKEIAPKKGQKVKKAKAAPPKK
jgi:cellulose synthase operon protein C